MLEAEADVEDAQSLAEAGDPRAALQKLHEALTLNPGNDDARYDYVKLLIENDMIEDAEAALAPALAAIPRQIRFEALGQFLDAIKFVVTDDRGIWTPEQFDALIATNKRDFASRFALAQLLMAHSQWVPAMDELLEILMRDKAWSEDLARKTFIAILDIIEPPKPKVAEGQVPPEDPTVATYRRRLSSVVRS